MVGLGVLYGALVGLLMATVFGIAIALVGPGIGLPQPHNLAGQEGLGQVWAVARVGLIAGAIGGAMLGVLVRVFARGRITLGRGIGVIAALLPLVWLPFFGTRALLTTPDVSFSDIGYWLLLVIVPIALAATAGAAVGGRLARAAGG
ncbi:MAG: hypothetical protein U0822_05330 [Anaerolineae bacterium]